MPFRRAPREPEQVPSPRPLLDMLICAMCGAPVRASRTSAGTLTATCIACGHRNTGQISSESGDNSGSGSGGSS